MTFSLVTICWYLYSFCLLDFYHLSKSLLGVVRWVYSLLSSRRCHIWKRLRSSASEQEKVWHVLCRHFPADFAAAQRHSQKQAAHLKGSSALVLLLVETESAWENGSWHTGIKYTQNELGTDHQVFPWAHFASPGPVSVTPRTGSLKMVADGSTNDSQTTSPSLDWAGKNISHNRI